MTDIRSLERTLLDNAHTIACLLGDREFVGREWFRFLKRHRIKFQMRPHKNTLVRNGRGQYAHAWRLFCRTRINCPLAIPEARKMWGMELCQSGCRLKDGEYLILVSSEFCEKPHEQYKKRWGIEPLFGALKSRGFNLEDTHLVSIDAKNVVGSTCGSLLSFISILTTKPWGSIQ